MSSPSPPPCQYFDYRNPGVPSIEDENFVTPNCLPPYLQFSFYIVFIILQSLVILYCLFVLIRSVLTHGRNPHKTTVISVTVTLSSIVRLTTYISEFVHYIGPWRYISIGLGLSLGTISASIILYQWLCATINLRNTPHFHNEFRFFKILLFVFNIVSGGGNIILWGVASHFRERDIVTFNWICFAAYCWFSAVNSCAYCIFLMVAMKRFQRLISSDMSKEVVEVAQKFKKLSSFLFMCSTNGVFSGLSIIIWFLVSSKGPWMSYFFFIIFLVFAPFEAIGSCILAKVAYDQTTIFISRTASAKGTEIDNEKSVATTVNSIPLKPIV